MGTALSLLLHGALSATVPPFIEARTEESPGRSPSFSMQWRITSIWQSMLLEKCILFTRTTTIIFTSRRKSRQIHSDKEKAGLPRLFYCFGKDWRIRGAASDIVAQFMYRPGCHAPRNDELSKDRKS